MKYKILIYILAIGAVISSCRKVEVENLFYDVPEARMKDTLEFIRNTLVDAPYGWNAGIGTTGKGGYGFYIKFRADNTLEMLSDYSEESSNTAQKSTYRVSALSVASLVFDTYNYITLMQDPVPGVAGGTAGSGYKSDIEFLYRGHSGDTLFFEGRKYKNPLILVKNTQEEEQALVNDGYKQYMDAFKNVYYNQYDFVYLDADEYLVSIELDIVAKVAVVSIVDKTDNSLVSIQTTPFYFTYGHINFIWKILYKDKLITSIKYNIDNQLKLVASDKTEVDVDNQIDPLYTIESAFAYNKPFKRILPNAVPGVVANEHIFTKIRELFAGTGRVINTMYFAFTNSTNAVFYIGYSSGTSNFVASATYEYRRNGNKLFMKRVSIDGGNNWSTRATEVAPANALFGSGEEKEFDIEWVLSEDGSVKYPIAAIRLTSDPQNMLYGKLGE